MMKAYVGTVDYDEGETEADALIEVQATISGEKGPFLREASWVIQRDGQLLCATLVIRWRELPFIAFTMTSSSHKRQGLAKACMSNAMRALLASGETKVRLLVTESNLPAVALYRSLGFAFEQ